MPTAVTGKLASPEISSLRKSWERILHEIHLQLGGQVLSSKVERNAYTFKSNVTQDNLGRRSVQASVFNEIAERHMMSFWEINAVKKQLKITEPEPKLPDPQSFTNRAALHRAYDDYQNELASLRGKISTALSFSEEDISYLEADRRRGRKTIKLRFAIYVLEREGFYHRPTSQGGLAGFYENALEVFYNGNHDASAIDIIPGRYLMIRRSLNSFYANAFILGRVNIWKDIDSNGDEFYRYRTYYEYTQEGLKRTRKSEGCIFNYQENARMMGGVEYTHVDETEFKQRPEAKKAQSKSNEDSVPTWGTRDFPSKNDKKR